MRIARGLDRERVHKSGRGRGVKEDTNERVRMIIGD